MPKKIKRKRNYPKQYTIKSDGNIFFLHDYNHRLDTIEHNNLNLPINFTKIRQILNPQRVLIPSPFAPGREGIMVGAIRNMANAPVVPLQRLSEHLWEYTTTPLPGDSPCVMVINRSGRVMSPLHYKDCTVVRTNLRHLFAWGNSIRRESDYIANPEHTSTPGSYDLLNANDRLNRSIIPSDQLQLITKKFELIRFNQGLTTAPNPKYYYATPHAAVISRTYQRIAYGEYLRVPVDFPVLRHTGAHISTLDESLLAFYPTERHIIDDYPQQIKPGRYLKRYFPNMTDDEIRIAVGHIQANAARLEIITDGDAMVDVYMRMKNDGVVQSCMCYEKWNIHPLQVYHNSDVQLAVMYRSDKPLARALVNRVTKEYPMIYGQWEAMVKLLDKHGYKHGTLTGAKINMIKAPEGGWRMPYIDAHRKLDRSVIKSSCVIPLHNESKFEIDDEPFDRKDHNNVYVSYFHANRHEVANIDGPDSLGEDEDEDDRDWRYCENCDDRYDADDEGGYSEYDDLGLCGYCTDHYIRAVICERGSQRAGLSPTIEQSVLQSTCESEDWYCDSDGTYYESEAAAAHHYLVLCSNNNEYIPRDEAIYIEDCDVWVDVYFEDRYVFTAGDDATTGGKWFTPQYANDNLYLCYESNEITEDESRGPAVNTLFNDDPALPKCLRALLPDPPEDEASIDESTDEPNYTQYLAA